jgi:hypothetical protein
VISLALPGGALCLHRRRLDAGREGERRRPPRAAVSLNCLAGSSFVEVFLLVF